MPLDHPIDRPRTGSDWIAPDCAGMDFFAADQGLRDLLAIYLPAGCAQPPDAALPAARAALPAAGWTNWPASPTAIRPVLHAAGPFRPRPGLDRIPPGLPRDGADRVRRLPVPRHVASRRRAGHGSPAAAGRQIRLPVPVRAGRVRPDVPDQRHRHLDPPDPQVRQQFPAGLPAAENAVGRPVHDVEGHPVHDREGRRVRRRRDRNHRPPAGRRAGGCTARNGSAPTPTPTSR